MIATVAKKKPAPSTFGRRLKATREAKGLTQAQVGEKVGMPATLIARLENRPDANPTLETIRKLAAALGCDPADLIAESE